MNRDSPPTDGVLGTKVEHLQRKPRGKPVIAGVDRGVRGAGGQLANSQELRRGSSG